MRIAVLADVHGNVLALEAVLADARRLGFDQMIDLGDTVSGPLWPAECFEMLEAAGAQSVRGNHDRVVGCDALADMPATDAFTHDMLSAAQRAALAARPAKLRLGEILAVHGTPDSDMKYLMHEATAQGVRERRAEELAEHLGDAGDARLVLCGHTHRAHAARLPDGRLVVNPGSVGMPAYSWDHPVPHRMEAGTPHARWALLEREPQGWAITHRQVVYDWDRAAAEAARNGCHNWAQALATGYVM